MSQKKDFSVGKYLGGFSLAPEPHAGVVCKVLDDSFIFTERLGQKLGRIRRNLINEVVVIDKSQITQRLTVPRIATLGLFALAAPVKEKHKEYCVIIDWDSLNGIRQNTVFEFTGEVAESSAYKAANTLKQYAKPKAAKITDDERKCPFCAEIIKLEAIKCRFCGEMFEPSEIASLVEAKQSALGEDKSKAIAGHDICPSCGYPDLRWAHIEDGGMGHWCPRCRESLKSMLNA